MEAKPSFLGFFIKHVREEIHNNDLEVQRQRISLTETTSTFEESLHRSILANSVGGSTYTSSQPVYIDTQDL